MKKKSLFLFLIFAIFGGMFFFSNKKDVIAENSDKCEVKTNYYLFTGVAEHIWFDEEWCLNVINTSGSIPKTCVAGSTVAETNKNRIDKNGNYYIINTGKFNLKVDGTIESTKVYNVGTSRSSITSAQFLNLLNKIRDNDTDKDGIYTEGNISYSTNIEWSGVDGVFTTAGEKLPTDANVFIKQVVSPDVEFKIDNFKTNGDMVELSIKRVWSSSTAANIYNNNIPKYDFPARSTDIQGYGNVKVWHVYSPGVYEVSYIPSDCEGEVIIQHVDEEKEEIISNDEILTGIVGDSWEYDCPTEITNNGIIYELNTKKKTKLSGEFTVENQNGTCYYNKKVEEEEKTYKVTVNFLEKDTNKKLLNSKVIETNLEDKATYSYTCDPIANYDLITTGENTGAINGKDAEINCYYNKKTYMVTINYGADEDCLNILKSLNYSNLVADENVKIDVPSKIEKLSLTGLGVYDNVINPAPTLNENVVNFTMPAKNVSVCIVYTPQTGSSNLGIVFVIGLITLGGSVYFVQKRKNNV